jgi:hypothetical protein
VFSLGHFESAADCYPLLSPLFIFTQVIYISSLIKSLECSCSYPISARLEAFSCTPNLSLSPPRSLFVQPGNYRTLLRLVIFSLFHISTEAAGYLLDNLQPLLPLVRAMLTLVIKTPRSSPPSLSCSPLRQLTGPAVRQATVYAVLKVILTVLLVDSASRVSRYADTFSSSLDSVLSALTITVPLLCESLHFMSLHKHPCICN